MNIDLSLLIWLIAAVPWALAALVMLRRLDKPHGSLLFWFAALELVVCFAHVALMLWAMLCAQAADHEEAVADYNKWSNRTALPWLFAPLLFVIYVCRLRRNNSDASEPAARH